MREKKTAMRRHSHTLWSLIWPENTFYVPIDRQQTSHKTKQQPKKYKTRASTNNNRHFCPTAENVKQFASVCTSVCVVDTHLMVATGIMM